MTLNQEGPWAMRKSMRVFVALLIGLFGALFCLAGFGSLGPDRSDYGGLITAPTAILFGGALALGALSSLVHTLTDGRAAWAARITAGCLCLVALLGVALNFHDPDLEGLERAAYVVGPVALACFALIYLLWGTLSPDFDKEGRQPAVWEAPTCVVVSAVAALASLFFTVALVSSFVVDLASLALANL